MALGFDGLGIAVEGGAVAASAAGVAADGVSFAEGLAVGEVAGAFEPEAHLGVGGHLVFP